MASREPRTTMKLSIFPKSTKKAASSSWQGRKEGRKAESTVTRTRRHRETEYRCLTRARP